MSPGSITTLILQGSLNRLLRELQRLLTWKISLNLVHQWKLGIEHDLGEEKGTNREVGLEQTISISFFHKSSVY